MPDWAAYVRGHLRLSGVRQEREAEIVEDLARQLDDAYRDALATGASAGEAEAQAERHISDWPALARQLSESPRQRLSATERWLHAADDRTIARRGGLTLAAQVRQDIVYGIRMLRRSPALAGIALLSLALGIGANTAIFTVIDALLFRPLPVPGPDQLVVLSNPESEGFMTGLENGERSLLSYHEFEGLRDDNTVVSGLFAFSSEVMLAPVTTEAEAPRPTGVTLVSGAYFSTLEVEPFLGRFSTATDDRARLQHPVAVVSYRFWESRLHRDPEAVGRPLRIRQTAFDIIGVARPDFTGIVVGEAPDVWVPLSMQEAVVPGSDWLTQPPGTVRRTMFLHVVGRLRPGVGLAQANTALNVTFARGLAADAAQIADAGRRRALTDAHLVVRSARDGLSPLRGEYAGPLAVLMALVGLLLLLACANVANLLLARATGRQREMAVRVALGAGRMRLIRQLLTESLLLASAGAALGLLVARWGERVLLRLVSGEATPVPLDIALNGQVLAFTIAVTVITALLFGLAPALRAARPDLDVVLRGLSRGIAGQGRIAGRWPFGKILASVQVAISLLLLVAAGLFIGSLKNLTAVPLGYEANHLLQFRVDPTKSGYARAAREALYERVSIDLRRLPGVTAASLSANGLFYGGDAGDDVSFPGYTPPPAQDMSARMDFVGPGYFSTVGIPVIVGRDVAPADSRGLRRCWLNQTMAREFFRDARPIGRQMVVHYSFGDAPCVVSGIVADSRNNSLRDTVGRRFYQPFFNAPSNPEAAIFQVRVAGDAAPVASAVRALLRETDATLDPPTFHTMPELIGVAVVTERLTARLSALFGGLALLLAAIGLYGVLSYDVTRRVSEIGVRMAMGAPRAGILRLVLREALQTTAMGAATGIAAALTAMRFLGSLLFGLTAHDPVTLAAAVGVLAMAAILAAVLPAWRASRIDPLLALRCE